MLNSDFLENYPLFQKLRFAVPGTLDSFKSVPIHMKCLNCKSDQTFNMTNEFHEYREFMNYPSNGQNIRLEYLCEACKGFERVFYIFIDFNLEFIYKVGQYPEWEIKIDNTIEKALGKHVTFFRKGLVCESQSYGIAAFAYYRRITEEIIDELLDSISDLIEPENKEKYLEALKLTKQTRVTQEKIDLVKDLLPAILKPNGMNPLGVLHSELSDGLHGQSDESCLEKAEHIKSILVYLITQIIHTKESGKSFSESMKKLLDKKSGQSNK
jgi:hypothetical protein